jgi:hypothetical protein
MGACGMSLPEDRSIAILKNLSAPYALLQPPVMYITSTGKMSKEKGVHNTPSSNRGM